MTDLVKDLTTINNIDENTLNKLINASINIISYTVIENIKNNNTLIKIDIGIGYLYLENKGSIIEYKFIPNNKLENTLKQAYNKKNILVNKINTQLNKEFNNVYKELFNG